MHAKVGSRAKKGKIEHGRGSTVSYIFRASRISDTGRTSSAYTPHPANKPLLNQSIRIGVQLRKVSLLHAGHLIYTMP